MTLQEIAKQYIDADIQNVAEISRSKFEYIVKRIDEREMTENAGFEGALRILATFIIGDGHFEESELALFNFIFNYKAKYEQVVSLLRDYENRESFQYVFDVMNSYDDEMRKNIIVFGLTVFTIDKKFSEPEEHYIQDLIKNRESHQ